MSVTELPRPTVDAEPSGAIRWMPTRAGILNVWRYYDEVFSFHDGRLLLRGPNGSGKSKALELLLPFLFDANLRAYRLSTFGTNERTMHWNLMGEGASGTTRVGYVWMEFHLADNPERWFTCGARLQASTHTSAVHADYFTTELRIGPVGDLDLVNDAAQPLTRGALEERLAGHGTVHPNAGDYRDEIRSTLFPSLSEQRYDALITALLQLRTPKLSQRLDPALLSTLLSRALPPLGQQEIADLAEGFERLDAQRERLQRLEEDVSATRTLADRQRSYAQRVLRSAAAKLISATTELDNLARTARRSAEEYDHVAEQRTAAERRLEELRQKVRSGEARKNGLTDSEAYKKGQELDRLRAQTGAAATRATRLRTDADRRLAMAEADQITARKAEQHAEVRAGAVRALELDSRQAAVRAGLSSVHEELVVSMTGAEQRSRQLLRAAIHGRRDQLESVTDALDRHERTVDRRQQAEADLEFARARLSAARDGLRAAAGQRELALTELGARLTEWARGCRELLFPDPAVVLDQVESESTLLGVVDEIATAVGYDIATEDTASRAALRTALAEKDTLVTELEGLTAQRDLPPAAPLTRTTDRSTMSGAPLWQLIDFAPSVSPETHADIEAALEASGLLDAWVGAQGAIRGHDTFADVSALRPIVGRSLRDVLVPERGTDVPAEIVQQLLDAVAFDEVLPSDSAAAIGADGAWRMGSTTGSWHKDHPSYVGTRARQRARERRAQELREGIASHNTQIESWESRLAALESRRQILANERAARPAYTEVLEATRTMTRAESDVESAESTVRQRIGAVTGREQEVGRALQGLTSLAAENGLPTQRAALSTLATAVGAFDEQAGAWLDEYGRLLSARHIAESAASSAERSAEDAGLRAEEAVLAAEDHESLAERLAAIESTFGVDYREVLAEMNALRDTLRDLGEEQRQLNIRVTTLAEQLGALRAQRSTDAAVRDDAAAQRDASAHRFRHLTAGSFPADSGFDDLATFRATLSGSDGVRAALEAARLISAAWPSVPYSSSNLGDALHRLSESVHDCREALSSRGDLDLETDEDVQVFTAIVDGIRVGAAELLNILRSEADQSRAEITERERELFDQTLTGDIRRHLAARIRQANEIVDGMNSRLDRVRTASKVGVRIVWQIAPDLPVGTKTARDLLLKDPVRLTEADRESLHQFFRSRIDQAKSDDTATSWEQQLAQVFDYTAWHQFVVKIDRENGEGWQLLTKKMHGALSGGEKAIALHLPLFAAVAAHYQVVDQAPRVILLDEVFVGVDTTNRGQIFALLSELDLDLMLTSDHEWCTYAELSGVGIHQLITESDHDDAVTTARFTWNGHELVPDDESPSLT